MSHFNLEISPSLLNLFETLFSVQLSDETARIRDVLSQLDTQLFKSYTKPHALQIAAWIEAGIFSPRWAAGAAAPNIRVADLDPSPFVSTVLLHLVTLHSQTSTTSPNSPLTGRILKALFEATAAALIAAFSSPRLPSISLPQPMQATLDVEFISQTLATYTTDSASQTQTDIYAVLDQKTDNKARVALQEELGGLRVALKRLREGTRGQFGCFRRAKRGTIAGLSTNVEEEQRGRR